MSKKKWEKPKLVVLVRGMPEEAILGVCKNAGVPNVGPVDQFTSECMEAYAPTCSQCSTRSGT